ncbi:hypothetical protein ABT369_19555 [Dactylosporangium sp. NPDC000244]|uniref:hypothetical protein n=1 Tax=Dactylosporangium sp. NPDC000244 TaxID=3154365 RepID=UPI00332FC51C
MPIPPATINNRTGAQRTCSDAAARQDRILAETREVAIASAGLAAELLPAGWTTHAAPSPDRTMYLLILTPPAGTAHAQLVAPHAGRGWAIGITDPAAGTDTVLRTAGGTVAYQATLADAVHAARTATQLAAPDARPTVPRHGQVLRTSRYVDSNCLIGTADPDRPHLAHVRGVARGGHPHVMLPTLRRIWAATSRDSTRLTAVLLAHDWHHLDPATTGGSRVVAGIGRIHDAKPEPVTVVPLATAGELDAAWIYLLDPGEDTVTVHTGDGDPISRHPLDS